MKIKGYDFTAAPPEVQFAQGHIFELAPEPSKPRGSGESMLDAPLPRFSGRGHQNWGRGYYS
jgi:hypothetical protein